MIIRLVEQNKLYMKPGKIPQYVNRQNNYPPSVLLKIPEAIIQRLSHISSDEQSFEAACPPYEEALSKSGYKFRPQYNPVPVQGT